MTKILFIVGRGRSGTTLLARMLTHHPLIAVAPEGFFAMNLERKYRAGPWNERRIAALSTRAPAASSARRCCPNLATYTRPRATG